MSWNKITNHKEENGKKFKLCPRCNDWKDLTNFHKNKKTTDGFCAYCKECKSKCDKKSYEKNSDIRQEKIKEYHENNKEEINKKRRDQWSNDPNCKKNFKEYRSNNPDKVKHWRKQYYQKNKVVINQKRAEKRRQNLDVRISNNLRARLNKALKGNHKSSSTFGLTGCSLEELKKHLECQFTIGMTWDNYGSQWHIDHIKPCAAFDLTLEEKQRECFNYSNLQPLWKEDNFRKNKYYEQER